MHRPSLRRLRATALTIAVSWLSLASMNAGAEELPAMFFGQLPSVQDVSVSPDGETVSMVLNTEDATIIAVMPFGGQEMSALIRLDPAKEHVEWVDWANDERLLVASSRTITVQATRRRLGRLFSIDIAGNGITEIDRKTTVTLPWWATLVSNDDIVSFLDNDPEHILLELWDMFDRAPAVFKVNVYNNDFEKQFPNTYDVDTWIANGDGDIVLGLEFDRDERTFWYRPAGDKKWQELHTRKVFEDATFSPLVIDDEHVIVLSDHALGRQAVWRYDIQSGEFTDEIHSVERFDVAGAIMSPDKRRIIGAYHYDDFRVDTYFDPEDATVSKRIANSFPEMKTTIVSRSEDRNRLVVSVLNDNSPPKYYWMDLAANTGNFMFSTYPNLEHQPLAKVSPIEFEARDGMLIKGYLTMPLDATEKPPLVVFPHGGPQSRDYGYFDHYVQYFANRGYATLQVNFRGSEGFGNKYEVAGYRQWGKGMQQDVYDAVDWLAEQATVDTNRACVVGASYGGYVALTASFQRPEQFRCFVSIAGISNLVKVAEATARFDTSKAFVKKTIGDPRDKDDKRTMADVSVINHLDEVRRPILLVHGTRDASVDVSQSKTLYKKARKAGIDIEYLEFKKGSHYTDRYEDRVKMFETIDRFLKRHLTE